MTERLALIVCLVGCGADSEVERVRDGDTIVLTSGEVVRYLTMNTPELGECYGDAAARENAALVVGKQVELTHDTREQDVYGRTLAYVSVDGRDIGAWLLEQGFARLDIIPPNVARENSYRALELRARQARRGLWSACP